MSREKGLVSLSDLITQLELTSMADATSVWLNSS